MRNAARTCTRWGKGGKMELDIMKGACECIR